jgi:primosomal protein N''
MAKRRLFVAIIAVVLGSLTVTGAALATDVRGGEPATEVRGGEPTTDVRRDRDGRDHRAFCERLESKIQHLRAALGRLEALEEKIERAIASGTLTEEQLVRARHALAKIERVSEALEEQLERAVEIYKEQCQR